MDLTLMMRQKNTMVTDFKTLRTLDVFVGNEVVNLKREQGGMGLELSAVNWFIEDGSRDVLLNILSFIFDLFERKMPEYELWLFSGHSAWQPDTRVVRYRRLWGSLKARGLEVSGGQRSKDYIVERNGGVKFFGALRLPDLSVENILKLMIEERCSYVVVLPSNFDVETIVREGWSGRVIEDVSFFRRVSDCGGLIVKYFGEFDDRERGFLSIGRLELVQALWSD
ncbi:hypothetical protein [Pseudomonas gingeri]|uniref:Uncharacterized protein n=1 Tax=Pseudomonas gingeri TaxID=117681 RepID=A0A7Y7WKK9_9PSED|nr:hypothetical protein [Pseudomonas gingeri]NWB51286.1 hypothetical protein [Pseudomonas gingeri]